MLLGPSSALVDVGSAEPGKCRSRAANQVTGNVLTYPGAA